MHGMAYNTHRTGFDFGAFLTPWVKRLLVANTVLFLLTLVVGYRFAVEWFGFSPGRVLTRPWGAVTYMFIHGGFWHLFMNMLVLFFFGPPLENRWGSREFIKFYLICGLGGVALSFLFVGSSIIGASAAVYGVLLAFAMNWPDSPIYIWGIFPVKAKWLATFLFVVTFLNAFGGTADGVAHFAHLGGLLTGFFYLKGDWQVSSKLDRIKRASKTRKFAIVPREGDDEGPTRRERPRRSAGWGDAEEEELLKAVDKILDKISARGMQSLTPEERRLLDEVSRRRRMN